MNDSASAVIRRPSAMLPIITRHASMIIDPEKVQLQQYK